jgi:hypothetical protein
MANDDVEALRFSKMLVTTSWHTSQKTSVYLQVMRDSTSAIDGAVEVVYI